mgnify:FL=1
MWIADNWKEYEVIDCSNGEKLERWGDYILVRPDPQVIWDTPKTRKEWRRKNGHYHRSKKGGGEWEFFDLPQQWDLHYKNLTFHCLVLQGPDTVFQIFTFFVRTDHKCMILCRKIIFLFHAPSAPLSFPIHAYVFPKLPVSALMSGFALIVRTQSTSMTAQSESGSKPQ